MLNVPEQPIGRHDEQVSNARTTSERKYQSLNFSKKFSSFNEQRALKAVAEMNGYQFILVKLQGDFIWHDHVEADETFIGQEGVVLLLTMRCLSSGLATSSTLGAFQYVRGQHAYKKH